MRGVGKSGVRGNRGDGSKTEGMRRGMIAARKANIDKQTEKQIGR